MKRTEGQKGITLIALVVTIVVLLILAGITITYVFSEGGLFATAREADKNQTAAYIRDYASNAQGQTLIELNKPGNTFTTDALKLAEAKRVFGLNFPTTNGWSAPDTTNLQYSAATYTYGGTFTVTVNGYTYTGTYTDGVLTKVEWAPASES